jgi:hypothetical protein
MVRTVQDTGAPFSKGLPGGARKAQAQDESLKRACRPLSPRSQVAGNSARERRDAEAQSDGPAPLSRTHAEGWSRPRFHSGAWSDYAPALDLPLSTIVAGRIIAAGFGQQPNRANRNIYQAVGSGLSRSLVMFADRLPEPAPLHLGR